LNREGRRRPALQAGTSAGSQWRPPAGQGRPSGVLPAGAAPVSHEERPNPWGDDRRDPARGGALEALPPIVSIGRAPASQRSISDGDEKKSEH